MTYQLYQTGLGAMAMFFNKKHEIISHGLFPKVDCATKQSPVFIRLHYLADIEKKLTERLDIHETAIVEVLQRIMTLLSPPPDEPEPPRRQIGFDVRKRKKRYS